MTNDAIKRLRVIAGPNGSGKSTLYKLLKQRVSTEPFVNADHIAKWFVERGVINLLSTFGITTDQVTFDGFMAEQGASWAQKANKEGKALHLSFSDNNLLADKSDAVGYDAAVAADFIRHELVKAGTSFTFETVLSHASKLNFLHDAQERGYQVYLYFISTVSPEINISRIKQRVQMGEHDVDDHKVRDRYELSLSLLPELARIARRAYVFDNSVNKSGIKMFAEIDEQQRIFIPDEDLPWWVVDRFLQHLVSSHTIDVSPNWPVNE